MARAYPVYQQLQLERFQTENASEGDAWPALNDRYRLYKLRRYAGGTRRASKTRGAGSWQSWPGAGTKMMIGTGWLAGAVIGPSQGNPFSGTDRHRAIFTDRRMEISVVQSGKNGEGQEFNYPQYAAETRPFMTFGQNSMDRMAHEVSRFIIEGR